MLYVAASPSGGWRAILVFCAASHHLKHREKRIGWTNEQRRRRLALVANNARFLILPGFQIPNLGTRVMRLALDRLTSDWQERYGHPLAAVETFVDPERFEGTVYRAGGWEELGQTSGWGRVGREYYERHDKPKRLYFLELAKNAARSLQADHLKPEWAMVEEKTPPRCTLRARELRNLVEHLKSVKDFRGRVGSYPVWSLLAMVALAYLCGGPRGQKDLAKFARGLNSGQRRALGVRRRPDGSHPSPSQPTFCRLLKGVDGHAVERAILAFQEQVRGPAPKGGIVGVDGKTARRGGDNQILTAVALPSLYYLGSEPVPVDKTNEIPVARTLFERLDLEGCLVGLDALHTQTQTARDLVQRAGADYLLTAKDNQIGVERRIESMFTALPAGFPPSTSHTQPGL
jgi:hypothetical protein